MADPLSAYDRVGDRARLHRQSDPRPIVIVEGTSDERFLTRLFGRAHAQILVGGTRDAVLGAARDVERHRLERCACVVDRDFDEAVASAEPGRAFLVAYDGADLEHMLMISPAFDDMVMELGSATKISRFGGVDKLRTLALEGVVSLASLRRANALYKWGIDFDSVDVARRVNRHTLEVDKASLIDAAFSASEGRVSRDELQRHSDASHVCPQTGSPMVRGRDALAVVGVALRRTAGSLSHAESAPERLANILRLAADASSLEQTVWFRKLSTVLE